MGAVQALCEFSLLVSQQYHSDLSLTALDDAQNWVHKNKGAFREQNMMKFPKATGDEQSARESYQLQEQKIHKIHAAMKVQVYGAEKVTTINWRQFQVHLNRPWQASTRWSNADQQRATEWLKRDMHLVTPVKCKLFDKLFQHLQQQLLQQVRTKATSPHSAFAKKLAQLTTAAHAEVDGAAKMTYDRWVKFHLPLSNAETKATTWSIADTEHVVN